MLPRRSRWSGGDGDVTTGFSNTGAIGDLAEQFGGRWDEDVIGVGL